MKEVQIAKIRVGGYDFRIVQRGDEFRLYRIWNELGEHGIRTHKTLDAKYEFYAEAIMTIARYAHYHKYTGRVPKLKELF